MFRLPRVWVRDLDRGQRSCAGAGRFLYPTLLNSMCYGEGGLHWIVTLSHTLLLLLLF